MGSTTINCRCSAPLIIFLTLLWNSMSIFIVNNVKLQRESELLTLRLWLSKSMLRKSPFLVCLDRWLFSFTCSWNLHAAISMYFAVEKLVHRREDAFPSVLLSLFQYCAVFKNSTDFIIPSGPGRQPLGNCCSGAHWLMNKHGGNPEHSHISADSGAFTRHPLTDLLSKGLFVWLVVMLSVLWW